MNRCGSEFKLLSAHREGSSGYSQTEYQGRRVSGFMCLGDLGVHFRETEKLEEKFRDLGTNSVLR